MDYKNTLEGRAVQSKYGQILHASRPEPPHNHPRMPMSNRAKIFSPFAALRGYEDEIASEGRDHLKGNRVELSEEGKEVLNQKISQLRKEQEITIEYFTDGYYEDIAGVLDAVDVINKELRIYTDAGKAAKAKEKELEEWLRGLDGMDRLVDDFVGGKLPLWEKIMDRQGTVCCAWEKTAFEEGLKVGIRLMIEAYSL